MTLGKYLYLVSFTILNYVGQAQTIDHITYTEKFFEKNTFYRELEMWDPNLCNIDSIKSPNCEIIDHYFTSKGNVISKYYCEQSFTEYYDIGIYTILDSGIIFTYKNQYVVKVKTKISLSPDTTWIEVRDVMDSVSYNSGILKKYKPHTQFFKNSNCADIQYIRKKYSRTLFSKKKLEVEQGMPWAFGKVFVKNKKYEGMFIDKIDMINVLKAL
jgi:hypothetical protein